MPVNRNALIRYKTIDKCLQNRFRTWTLEDLIEACSDALYEYEGIDKGVSRRTVQGDIQVMRSDKLGYNAPIVVREKKYYTYEDPDYSITNIPLSEQDLNKLTEAVEFMKQFQGFSHFRSLEGMVQKLEDHISSTKDKHKPVIDFEKNENLKGLEFLDPIYRAILQKKPLYLEYQSFKARKASEFLFHPYLLKEFRNRWFVIGMRNAERGIVNLALDRIQGLKVSELPLEAHPDFDADTYFDNSLGVSVSPGQKVEDVRLFADWRTAPYIITKPLHPSQEVLERNQHGIVIGLRLKHNFELEKAILEFGEQVRVLGPPRLKRAIKNRLVNAVDAYETELGSAHLKNLRTTLNKRGSVVLKRLYSRREVQKIRRVLDQRLHKTSHAQRALLRHIPDLIPLLLSPNLLQVVQAIDKKARIVKATYFDKPDTSNWFVTWHQDTTINVVKRKEIPGFGNWTEKAGVVSCVPPTELLQQVFSIRIHLDDTTAENGALNILPGSHKQRLDDEARALICENSMPSSVEVPAGGIHLLKPLLLHASGKSRNQKKRRVIHLEFCSAELPEGLEWAELEDIGQA